MANANRPSGLSPVRYLNASPYNGAVNFYWIPSTDGTVIAVGDPVASGGTASAVGIPTVTLATAGSPIRGVVMAIGAATGESVYVDPDALGLRVIPATKTKNYVVAVADDPNIIFEVQEIGTGTQLTATEVGLNANLVAGTNNGYVSGWLIDNTTEAVTATLNVRLLRLSQKPNNAFGAYAKWDVLINAHELRVGSVGV